MNMTKRKKLQQAEDVSRAGRKVFIKLSKTRHFRYLINRDIRHLDGSLKNRLMNINCGLE